MEDGEELEELEDDFVLLANEGMPALVPIDEEPETKTDDLKGILKTKGDKKDAEEGSEESFDEELDYRTRDIIILKDEETEE